MTNTGEDILSITDIKTAYSGATVAAVSEQDEDYAVVAEDENDEYTVTYMVDAATFSLARTLLIESEEEEIPEETESETTEIEEPESETTETEETETTESEIEAEFNYDIINASISISGSKNHKKTVITVETTQDVVELKIVEGHKNVKYSSMEYKDQEDGTRVWTIVLSNSSNGNKTYTVTGYGEDGTSGESATVSNKSKR